MVDEDRDDPEDHDDDTESDDESGAESDEDDRASVPEKERDLIDEAEEITNAASPIGRVRRSTPDADAVAAMAALVGKGDPGDRRKGKKAAKGKPGRKGKEASKSHGGKGAGPRPAPAEPAAERPAPASARPAPATSTGASPAPDASPPHPVMAGLDIFIAAVMILGIWLGLPTRWWPVDVFGSALAMALTASGAALLLRTPWAEKLAWGVGLVTTVVGMTTFTALAFTASTLAGMYGPIGGGGALLLLFIALLFFPYLVVFPAAKVYFLSRGRGGAG